MKRTLHPFGMALLMVAAFVGLGQAQSNLPPTILSQPQSVLVTNGATPTLSVTAVGSLPLGFQWQFNGTNFPGINPNYPGTSSNLILFHVTTPNAGPYDCVITNAWGRVTSSVATVTIAFPPGITNQPVSQLVTNFINKVTFSVGVTGSGPFTYQWVLNGNFLPNNIITTVAGNAGSGYSGDGGPATNALLSICQGVAADADGNFFIADANNQRIRKVNASGLITTVAGNGYEGYSGNGLVATNSSLALSAQSPISGVAVDVDGNLFIGDTYNNRLREVTYDFLITVAGNGLNGHSGDGGPAYNAELWSPAGVAADGEGNVYFCDAENGRIRQVDLNDNISTVAGNGTNIFSGDGGAATNASLDVPMGVAVDAFGNLYIADTYNSRIRKVNANGIIATVAGRTGSGYSGDGGAATNASLFYPCGVAVDASGNLYIADTENCRVRKVNASGIITTVAGKTGAGFSGDGGAATNATLRYPAGVAIDAAGNLLIADSGNYRIRKVTPQGPVYSLVNVNATNAGNYQVIVSSASGSVTSSVAVLTVDLPPLITRQPTNQSVVLGGNAFLDATVGGTPPLYYQWQFNGTNLMPGDSLLQGSTAGLNLTQVTTNNAGSYNVIFTNAFGNVTSSVAVVTITYPPTITNQTPGESIVNGSNTTLSVGVTGTGPFTYQWLLNGTNLPNGIIATVAGTGVEGYSGDGGPATNAELWAPWRAAVDAAGDIFIADTGNERIRKVNTAGIITTVAGTGTAGYSGDGGEATNATINAPIGITVDGTGDLFIADSYNNCIRKATPNGIITTVAGNGTNSFSGDGGAATNASLSFPNAVAVDAYGHLFIADTDNNRIREVGANGIISTVAGGSRSGYAGDGGPATNASLFQPTGVSVDGSGNIFIADMENERIRQVDTNGIITTVAGNGAGGYAGDGGAAAIASLAAPYDVAVDVFDDLFIVDTDNQRIRKVGSGGIITTVAGDGGFGLSGDGGSATSATLNYPEGATLDSFGNLFIADTDNNAIREVLLSAGYPSLILDDVTTNTAGNYQVIVSSAWGSVTSSVIALNVAFPPAITDQPMAETIINGSNATLTVAATGTAPLSYQWQFDGTNLTDGGDIAGSGTTNLILTPVTEADAGRYDVIITNAWGSVTSSVAVLNISYPPAIANEPASQTIINGGNPLFTVTATGTAPLSYQWQFEGTNLTDGSDVSGSATPSLVLTQITAANAGQYDVIITNAWGNVTSAVAALTIAYPPTIYIPPTNQTKVNGGVASFGVTALGTGPFIYQWQFAGTNLTDGGGLYGSDTADLVINQVTATNAGSYDVIITSAWGSVTSSVVTLTIAYPPAITSQPGSQTNISGHSASFSVAAAGTPALSYHWQFNGASLTNGGSVSGATTASLTLNPTTNSSAGLYDVVIANAWGSVTSSVASLTLVLPPAITASPAGEIVSLGANTGFAVEATGTPPLAYQWQFASTNLSDGGQIAGSGTYQLLVKQVTTNNVGFYRVIITNAWGRVTSSLASLTIGVPPAITNQPVSIVTNVQANAYLTVGASGTPPLAYQWQFNGTNLPVDSNPQDANTDRLFFDSVRTNYVGSYDVVITNSWGSVTSSVVTLTIPYPPTITSQPASQALTNAGSATFTVGASGAGPFTYQWLFNSKYITNNLISTVAGTNTSGSAGDGGLAINALLSLPGGVALDASGNLFIADTDNSRIRKVSTNGIITTLAGNGNAGYNGNGNVATNSWLDYPAGVVADAAGDVFIADTSNERLRAISYGIMITLAGTGAQGYAGDGGPAYDAELSRPAGVAMDADGNIYVADTSNSRIRKVDVNDNITTVAGNGNPEYGGDGGAATNASLDLPRGVAVDASGNLYIADCNNRRIREVNTNGVITTLAGNGVPGYAGDGGAATNAEVNFPAGIAVDAAGNVYIADTANSRIRKINPAGIITTVAGNGTAVYAGDGGAATNASLNQPTGVTVDAYGNLFIADSSNNRIRKVTPQGPVLTVANLTATNAGNYQVIVANPYGSVTSTVAVLTLDLAPAITQQPANLTLTNGGSGNLSVSISGNPLFGYRWLFNGSNVVASGSFQGTPILLELNHVTATNAGPYYIIITNLYGSVTSSVATVTVDLPPSIIQQPVSQTVIAGGSATFNLTATGTAPLIYQWRFNGNNLASQTNSTLALPYVSATNAGSYQVLVTNLFGAVFSSAAALTETAPQISSVTVTNGGVTLGLLTAPNVSSEVWMATNLTPPVTWQSIYTNFAGTNGVWQFTDTKSGSYPVRFYKTSTP